MATTTEENKALARRLVEEFWNQGNLGLADEFFSPDAVRRELFSNAPVKGPEGLRQVLAGWRKIFPDLQVTVNEMLAEGDKVVTYWTSKGTHLGEWNGVAPTGKQIVNSGISIDRIVNGKIIEEIVAADLLNVMKQLGVIPE
jgi:steroid delta-isomerase-like uncharacterized protein